MHETLKRWLWAQISESLFHCPFWLELKTILWKSCEHITRLDHSCFTNTDCWLLVGLGVYCFPTLQHWYVCLPKSLVGIFFFLTLNIAHSDLIDLSLRWLLAKATATFIFHGLQEWHFPWEEFSWWFIRALSQGCWGGRRPQRESQGLDALLESLKDSSKLFLNSSCWANSCIEWYWSF